MIRKVIGVLSYVGSLLHAGGQAQAARWELEISQMILSRKEKLLLTAFFPPLLTIGFNFAFAENIPSRIPILGGSKAFMPAFVTPAIFYMSILVRLLAGLITGVIGAGTEKKKA